MSQKYCLKWNDFASNASKAFRLLMDEDFLQDVTLVGDDNSQIAAHKLVLSACSEYFNSIFKKNKHSHPFLCLEGVNSMEIQNLLAYMYNGEVSVFQEDLDNFLLVAQRFKLEGLLTNAEVDDTLKQENLSPSSVIQDDSKIQDRDFQEHSPAKRGETLKVSMTDEEKNDLNGTLNQYVDKNEDGTWNCTICDSFSNKYRKDHVKRHIKGNHLAEKLLEENHLEGISPPCHLCGQLFRSRKDLEHHKRNPLNAHKRKFDKIAKPDAPVHDDIVDFADIELE